MHFIIAIFNAVKQVVNKLKFGRKRKKQDDTLLIQVVKRLFYPFTLLIIILFGGSLGYYFIGLNLGKKWEFLDCLLMTSITLTTVGYGDIFNAMDSPLYKIYTIIIMWTGMGIALYAVSTITAFVVEEQLGHYFRERKMKKRIDELKNHYIICGGGNMGIHVIDEMVKTSSEFIVIEQSEERLKRLKEEFGDILYLKADATNEHTLKTARIDQAKGLIATLGSDSLNMLLVVTAKYLNRNLRVVTRCIDHHLADKFRLSGADSVVSANLIGGLRLASEMLRPTVVSFLDKMLRAPDPTTRFEEVTLGDDSDLVGKTLASARIGERTGLTVVAIRRREEEHFHYNPKGDTELRPGDVLVVIGGVKQIQNLKRIAEGY